MKLTEKDTIPEGQISGDLLLHVVDPNDATDDPSGTSFKMPMSELNDSYVSATENDTKQGDLTMDGGSVILNNEGRGTILSDGTLVFGDYATEDSFQMDQNGQIKWYDFSTGKNLTFQIPTTVTGTNKTVTVKDETGTVALLSDIKTRVLDWNNNNVQLSNTGNALQTIYTLAVAANTFTKAGQCIEFAFWGQLSNMTGNSTLQAIFGPNDASPNDTIASGSYNFHLSGSITSIDGASERLIESGEIRLTSTSAGTTISYVMSTNAEGDPYTDARDLILKCEGVTGAITLNLNNWLVKFIDS